METAYRPRFVLLYLLLVHSINISTGKYANYYEWITYAQADVRRRNIGSAVHKLFKDGVLRGEDYETVGIWAPNRPGQYSDIIFVSAALKPD